MKNLFKLLAIAIILLNAKLGNAQWYQQTFNPTLHKFNSVYFINPDTGWVAGWGIMRTNDGGNTWFDQNINSGELNKIFFIDSANGWAVGGAIFHTIDGGTNWSQQTVLNNYWLSDVYFINHDTGWVAGCDNYGSGNSKSVLFKTIDGGNNWINMDSTHGGFCQLSFIDENNGWATGNDYHPYYRDIILKTTNGGQSWLMIDSLFSGNRTDIIMLDSNMGWTTTTYGTDGSINKTNDGGINWNQQYADMNRILNSVYFYNKDTGWAVGGGIGSYSSYGGIILNTTDAGNNWNTQASVFNYGLSDVFFIDSIRGWAVGWNKIFSTINGGCCGIINSEKDYENNISINIYPNPFINETEISFQSIKQSAFIKIYDICGKEIKTFKKEPPHEDITKIKIDGSALAPGIYICELLSEGLNYPITITRIIKIN